MRITHTCVQVDMYICMDETSKRPCTLSTSSLTPQVMMTSARLLRPPHSAPPLNTIVSSLLVFDRFQPSYVPRMKVLCGLAPPLSFCCTCSCVQCALMCVRLCVLVCVGLSMYVHACMCMYVCMYVCICMYVCMYIYIYIYIYGLLVPEVSAHAFLY